MRVLQAGLSNANGQETGSVIDTDDNQDSSQQVSSLEVRAIARQSGPDVTSALGSQRLLRQLSSLEDVADVQAHIRCAAQCQRSSSVRT